MNTNRDDDVVLVLRPLPDDIPVPVRLRQLLKVALRRFRLKCVRVDGVADNDLAEPPPGPEQRSVF